MTSPGPAKSPAQLDREIADALARHKMAARMGSRAYGQAHANIGDSTDARLGEGSARRVAAEAWSKPEDREAFVKAWLAAREEHLADRRRYHREPFLPLPGLDF